MTKENWTQFVVIVAALIVAIVTALWPTQAGTWGPIIINYAVPLGCLLVAIFFPAGKAVAKVFEMRARAAYYNAVRSGALRPVAGSLDNGAQNQVDDLLKSIYAELKTDEIAYKDDQGNIDPVPIAPRLVRDLANKWNDPNESMAFKQVLLQTTINTASAAFKAVTNINPPSTWAEVAAPQTYWLTHKVECSIHSAGLFHQVLMPLRTALKIRDTGNV
ncbi:MAG: hypothetical protein JW901_09860 [Dehalococcoidia bacterium]|nr:hypothetical protein [Dehalococcoidia bacterium]